MSVFTPANSNQLGNAAKGYDPSNQGENGNIRTWDISSVLSFQYMLKSRTFNADVGGWDTSSVTRMKCAPMIHIQTTLLLCGPHLRSPHCSAVSALRPHHRSIRTSRSGIPLATPTCSMPLISFNPSLSQRLALSKESQLHLARCLIFTRQYDV